MNSAVAVTDPVQSAKDAGLRYVSDLQPGIVRKRHGKGFRYVGPDGKPVRDREVLQRIQSLVIPPAWTDVWISTSPKGHLQATGRDAKGRKQSRYHPRWREVRDETKYERMLIFGAALPALREHVVQDLGVPGMPRRKVLATIARLMETTLIRVGNEEYARANHSYGLTTMRVRHVEVEGSTVTFKFQGKSGVRHTIDINDRRIAKIIRRCQDLPGYELFQYVDSDGEQHSIDSADVNEYLREISGQDFTAKDFRTWAGTVLACMTLRAFDAFESDTQAKKNVVCAIKEVAAKLGNTPSVCRKCYVHPAVLECYLSGSMAEILKKKLSAKPENFTLSLANEELAVLRLLRNTATENGVRARRPSRRKAVS
ncbi:DNA topoisomerase-1 [Silvibacterium bohemicum]|uniref:DNA topoisomerase n=1 Tax=Silvibacterium bohemicum TaxID=1577686 RepID=A0A841JP80_9BACT|nr:DNA topoisomerase IB [Silvibacterium bohemicum]MBB6143156.1 DNA topoisomerase-1 [Silvibacterium bohemicum]